MGLIFVVEGTHEIVNTTKISAYTVRTLVLKQVECESDLNVLGMVFN